MSVPNDDAMKTMTSEAARHAVGLIMDTLDERGYDPELVSVQPTQAFIGATSPSGVDLSITVGRTL